MTIIEAIKSGKVFTRKNKCYVDGEIILYLDDTGNAVDFDGRTRAFFVEDILADDWQVREE